MSTDGEVCDIECVQADGRNCTGVLDYVIRSSAVTGPACGHHCTATCAPPESQKLEVTLCVCVHTCAGPVGAPGL